MPKPVLSRVWEPSAPSRGQMSHPNRLDRGPRVDARRVRMQPRPAAIVPSREAFMAFWADLVARRCGSREVAAVTFEVTFQTACNWFDRFSCPTGDKVAIAVALWPEEFAGGCFGVAGGAGRGR